MTISCPTVDRYDTSPPPVQLSHPPLLTMKFPQFNLILVLVYDIGIPHYSKRPGGILFKDYRPYPELSFIYVISPAHIFLNSNYYIISCCTMYLYYLAYKIVICCSTSLIATSNYKLSSIFY